MAVDSAAVFKQRVLELGLSDAFSKFENNGWKTHGLFAFAVPQGPGGIVDDAVFKERVLKKVLEFGDEEEPPAMLHVWFKSACMST